MRSRCKREGCDDVIVGRGLCNKHYIRETRGISDDYRKRLKINDECFHGDLNEIESYYIGVIQSDGWLYPRPGNRQIEIGLKMNDEEVVKGFADFVNLSYKVKEGVRKEKPNTRYWRINFSRDKMANRLIELGVTPDKTIEEYYPYGVEFRHYLRGLIDGDGFIDSANRPNIMVTGEGIRDDIEDRLDNVGFDFNSILTYENKEEGLRQFTIYLRGGQEGYKGFLDWLYENASMYMKRKYDRYKKSFYK